MKLYILFLKRLGYNLTGTPRYISNRTLIDGTDPSLITIGDDVVISSHVRVLTHDFSLARVDKALGMSQRDSAGQQYERKKVAGVSIGDNSFVGAYSILMPGSSYRQRLYHRCGICCTRKGAQRIYCHRKSWTGHSERIPEYKCYRYLTAHEYLIPFPAAYRNASG